MTNIWGFSLQTISVLLVAALLFVIKGLFTDKLSPRWQYGIWSIFALRILLPVTMRRYVLLDVPLWMETRKGMAEQVFDSAFSAVYTAICVRWPFPNLSGKPQSITDWCILRALHWCNPFLQYVFDRIKNDMVSLLDQRVLELLEGGERRKYGGILLSMANERLSQSPRHYVSLKRRQKHMCRITAIVRFNKYPQGMALVSVTLARLAGHGEKLIK